MGRSDEPDEMNLSMLHRILATQAHTFQQRKMRKLVARIAREMGATVEQHDGNLYVTKGMADIYPCIVAHLDTVHKLLPDDEYHVHYDEPTGEYFAWNPKTSKQVGIGGDDKCGIFIALAILEATDAIKLAFFRDEEYGCLGAGNALMGFFDDCAFVLECDRKGKGDFIQDGGVELYGDEFARAIGPLLKAYEYKETWGMLTDVVTLKENGLSVAAANMSCGYYDPHTERETIVLADLAKALNLARAIVQELSYRRWTHTAKASKWGDYWSKDGLFTGDDFIPESCPHCRGTALEYDDSQYDWYCWECGMYTMELEAEFVEASER